MTDPLELRVVSGRPDDAELAVVVAVLVAASARPTTVPAPAPRPRWGDPATLLRPGGTPGPGGWAAPRA